MSHPVLRIDALPHHALDAASEFHATWLGQARALIDGGPESVTIVMPPAPYDHADWRRAAARDLARAVAPVRVNVIASGERAAIASALRFLEGAQGVTGQYLPLDSAGAGNPAD
jgi:hypothetical protein